MAVEGRTWNLNLRLSFFTGAAFGNINHPAMLRFPFRTYRSLLVPARCSRRTVGHFPYRFIRTVRCGAFSASCVGSLCRFACGKCRADDCRPLSCAGRALLCLAGTFMVRIRLGRSGVRCRSAAVRRVRDGRKIGPDRPFPLVGSQCRVSGRPVSGPKVRMCKSSAKP